MKHFIAIFLTLIISLPLFSQYEYSDGQPTEEFIPKTYIGLSTGINNFNGMLGVLAETKIISGLTLIGGVGIGSWGYKTSIGARYYNKYPKRIYYFAYFSSASGLKGFETELDTYQPGGKQNVKLDLYRANNVNFSLGYQWKLGKRFRINLELGYSVLLTHNPYKVISNGVVLSDESEKVMDLLTPGGIIFGFGSSFGF